MSRLHPPLPWDRPRPGHERGKLQPCALTIGSLTNLESLNCIYKEHHYQRLKGFSKENMVSLLGTSLFVVSQIGVQVADTNCGYSLRQYRTRITQWGKDKNVKPQEMSAIVRKRQRRKLVEVDKGELSFKVRDVSVEPQKIDRWMKRYAVPDSQLYAPSPAARKFAYTVYIFADILKLPHPMCTARRSPNAALLLHIQGCRLQPQSAHLDIAIIQPRVHKSLRQPCRSPASSGLRVAPLPAKARLLSIDLSQIILHSTSPP